MPCLAMHHVRWGIGSSFSTSAKLSTRPAVQPSLLTTSISMQPSHLAHVGRDRKRLECSAHSAQADELSSRRSRSWNSKIGAIYQDLLPGPLLFLPSLLQPASTLISLEGAEHGHEWVHWVLSLLPVTQVCLSTALVQPVCCSCCCCCICSSHAHVHSDPLSQPRHWTCHACARDFAMRSHVQANKTDTPLL